MTSYRIQEPDFISKLRDLPESPENQEILDQWDAAIVAARMQGAEILVAHIDKTAYLMGESPIIAAAPPEYRKGMLDMAMTIVNGTGDLINSGIDFTDAVA